MYMLVNSYFLSAIWLTYGQFCAISKWTVQFHSTDVNHFVFMITSIPGIN